MTTRLVKHSCVITGMGKDRILRVVNHSYIHQGKRTCEMAAEMALRALLLHHAIHCQVVIVAEAPDVDTEGTCGSSTLNPKP